MTSFFVLFNLGPQLYIIAKKLISVATQPSLNISLCNVESKCTDTNMLITLNRDELITYKTHPAAVLVVTRILGWFIFLLSTFLKVNCNYIFDLHTNCSLSVKTVEISYTSPLHFKGGSKVPFNSPPNGPIDLKFCGLHIECSEDLNVMNTMSASKVKA